jgi:hypothetical protein
MNSVVAVEVFAEDAAHEAFLLPFIKRLAAQEHMVPEISVRTALGGHGRVLSEFDLFGKLVSSGRLTVPDFIVVCIDANCRKYAQAREEIVNRTDASLRGCVAVACPDPHIERWYMGDPECFASVVGVAPSLPRRKCQRDSYKSALMNAIRQAGHLAPLGGIEFASELVDQMDLFRACRGDKSLKAFTDELKGTLTRLASPPST